MGEESEREDFDFWYFGLEVLLKLLVWDVK